MPLPRLTVDDALGVGAEIALDDAPAHKLTSVLRLKPGDGVRVFNARDGEWRASLVEATKRGARVRVEAKLRDPAAPRDLDLLFAPVKRHATDLIVEKATELGVARIRPVITQRTIAETVRVDRLAQIAREAAEQTERFDAPAILAPLPLAKIVDGWDGARALIFADESGDEADKAWGGNAGRARPILDALSATPFSDSGRGDESSRNTRPPCPLPGGGAAKLALLIGPEGGFTPDERRMLRGLPFVTPVSLGPRILRAETAVIAALSIIQAAWGDWRA